MIQWFTSRCDIEKSLDLYRPIARAAQDYVYEKRELQGWCSICRCITTFHLENQDSDWVNLRELLLCGCGMNARNRMVFCAFDDRPPTGRFVLMERVTTFFERVSQKYPFAEGCEFFHPDLPPGTIQRIGDMEVRHEDMLNMSFPNESIDYLFHGDVLEHVPDLRQGLAECYRVIKHGGTLLFTCPFYDLDRHKIRCKIVDGEMKHVEPPVYHGNPMDPKGALVFTEPGWGLFEDLREVGFRIVEAGLLFDPFQGILRDGNPYEKWNMWPVLFRAKK